MKTKTNDPLSSIFHPLLSKAPAILTGALRLGKLACRIPFLRTIPQLRPMDYACPIIEEIPTPNRRSRSALRAPSSALAPPAGPPRLRLRKRRRVTVRPTRPI